MCLVGDRAEAGSDTLDPGTVESTDLASTLSDSITRT